MLPRFTLFAGFTFVLVVSTASLPSAEADEVWAVPEDPVEVASVSRTSGLSFGIGFGYQTPQSGVQASYDLRLANSGFALVPWGGIGMWTAPTLGSHSGWLGRSGIGPQAAFAGGLMAMYGDHERLVVDLALAPTAFDVDTEYRCGGAAACPPTSKASVTYGPTVGIGYEHVGARGFVFRPMLAVNHGGTSFQLLLGAKLF